MSSAVLPVFYPANLCEPLTLGSNGIVTDIVYDRLLGAVSSRCRRTKPDVSSVLLAPFFPVLQGSRRAVELECIRMTMIQVKLV